jgi:hypothetical protein
MRDSEDTCIATRRPSPCSHRRDCRAHTAAAEERTTTIPTAGGRTLKPKWAVIISWVATRRVDRVSVAGTSTTSTKPPPWSPRHTRRTVRVATRAPRVPFARGSTSCTRRRCTVDARGPQRCSMSIATIRVDRRTTPSSYVKRPSAHRLTHQRLHTSHPGPSRCACVCAQVDGVEKGTEGRYLRG